MFPQAWQCVLPQHKNYSGTAWHEQWQRKHRGLQNPQVPIWRNYRGKSKPLRHYLATHTLVLDTTGLGRYNKSDIWSTIGPSWFIISQAHLLDSQSEVLFRPVLHFTVFITFLFPKVLWCGVVLLWRGWSSPGLIRDYTWSAQVFGWMFCVKWSLHEFQDPGFSCRTFHCSKVDQCVWL